MYKRTIVGKVATFIQPSQTKYHYSNIYKRLLDENDIKDKLQTSKNSNLSDFFNNDPKYKVIKEIFSKMKANLLPKGMNPNETYPAIDFFYENGVITDLFEWISTSVDDINLGNGTIRKHAILIGNKGSGKTLTQNIILYKNKEWFKNNEVFWVRCDMQKLFQLWDGNEVNHYVTVEDYLNIQLLYVFCKYHNKNHFFTNVMAKLLQKNSELYNFIHNESFIISNFENLRKYKNSNTSYAVDEILINSSPSKRQKAFKKWETHSLTLQTFIIEEFKGKFLFILDGVDNIDLNHISSSNLYNKMLEQTRIFLQSDNTNNYLYFTSMRPRTRAELGATNKFPAYNRNFKTPDEFFEIELEFNAKEKKRQDRNEFLSNIIDLRFKNCIKVGTDQNKYETKVKEILEVIIQKETNTQINSLYHENCRNYLFNKFNTILFMMYRWVKDGEYNDYNFDDTYEKLNNQSLLLNGKLFFNSLGLGTENADTGYFMFNIFFFESKFISKNTWPGLCCLRIMQFLEYKYKSPITKELLVDYFTKIFRYPEVLISKYLNYLREYGMIDSELEDINSKKIITLNISRKGTVLLSKITNNLEWLYYFSLDTYFPNDFLHNNKLSSHSLQNFTASNYHFHCIFNGLYFIKFLKQIEYYEIENLKDTIDFKEDVYNSTFNIQFNIEKISEFITENKTNLNNEQFDIIYKHFKLRLNIINKRAPNPAGLKD